VEGEAEGLTNRSSWAYLVQRRRTVMRVLRLAAKEDGDAGAAVGANWQGNFQFAVKRR
jgi:hypothetical protein